MFRTMLWSLVGLCTVSERTWEEGCLYHPIYEKRMYWEYEGDVEVDELGNNHSKEAYRPMIKKCTMLGGKTTSLLFFEPTFLLS